MKPRALLFIGVLIGMTAGMSTFLDCNPMPSPTPTPTPISDSAPQCVLASCTCAAQNLATLEGGTCKDLDGISYAQPNRTGEMFVQTCQSAQTNHIQVPVACLVSAHTCAEAKSCK
jgi:hypothetical protein